MDHIYLIAEAGQVNGVLDGDVAAAHHQGILLSVKAAVTGGTVGDPVSGKLFFAGSAQVRMCGAAGDNDGLCLIGIVIGDDFLYRTCQIQGGHDDVLDGDAQLFGVLGHPVGQVHAGNTRQTGIVIDFIGIDDLSAADKVLLQDQGVQSCSGSIDTCCQACGAGADDYKIIHGSFLFLLGLPVFVISR